MDKILRNVIIFATMILVIAAVFTIVTLSKRASLDTGTSKADMNSLGGNVNDAPDGEVQDVKLSVSGGTYILTPSVLKKDVPVRMVADLTTVRGCSRDVVISAFGVRKYVKEGDNVITFTPTKAGTITIACSMNMYRGTFTVTDNGDISTGMNLQAASQTEQSQTVPTIAASDSDIGGCTMSTSGGSCGCGASSGGCGCGR